MRETLNDLEKQSDHRILCMAKPERDAVLTELNRQGYVWGGGRALLSSVPHQPPQVLFIYGRGAYGRDGQKVVLHNHSEIKITAENRIITAAEWLRGNKYFDGVDCTIPEETA